jgi:hypothetical protein
MYNPTEGLLTFSGTLLLPSCPPTPPIPHMPALDMLETLTTHALMPCTPAPSMLVDMQSLLNAYLHLAYLHVHLRCSMASCVLPPYCELWRLGAGARSHSPCTHHHRRTGTVSLHGHGLGVWHQMICTSHTSPGTQRGMEMHVCIGHLWQIAGLPVQVVMRPCAMTLMMATCSISCHLSWRTQTR